VVLQLRKIVSRYRKNLKITSSPDRARLHARLCHAF